MRRKRRALLLLLLVTLPWLAGCWDRMEIEEAAYALAVGVEKGDRSRYKVTVAIAKPDKLAGKEGGSEGKPTVFSTVEAPSLTGALSVMNGFMGRIVNLDHAKALFLDETLARADGLKILDELLRFRQTRRTMFFIVTKDSPSDLLKGLAPKLDKNPMRFIEQLTYNYRETAMLPASSQVNRMASDLNVNYTQPLAYYAALVEEEDKEEEGSQQSQAESGFKAGQLPRQGGTNVEMIGAAAFRGQRMVGVMTGEEMRHVLMLQDRFREAFCTFKDPKSPGDFVSVQLSRGRPLRMAADLSGNRPRLTGTVTLEAEILAIQSGIDYSEPEQQVRLERAIADQVKEQIQLIVKKTQGWETDVIGLGKQVVRLFPTVEAWESYNWPQKFPTADVDVEVKVTLRRFGLTLSPVETKK
jgi:spore germination protein KC